MRESPSAPRLAPLGLAPGGSWRTLIFHPLTCIIDTFIAFIQLPPTCIRPYPDIQVVPWHNECYPSVMLRLVVSLSRSRTSPKQHCHTVAIGRRGPPASAVSHQGTRGVRLKGRAFKTTPQMGLSSKDLQAVRETHALNGPARNTGPSSDDTQRELVIIHFFSRTRVSEPATKASTTSQVDDVFLSSTPSHLSYPSPTPRPMRRASYGDCEGAWDRRSADGQYW